MKGDPARCQTGAACDGPLSSGRTVVTICDSIHVPFRRDTAVAAVGCPLAELDVSWRIGEVRSGCDSVRSERERRRRGLRLDGATA